MTTLDLSLGAPRAGLLAALLRDFARIEWPRLRRAPRPAATPRLSEHLLRDLGLTPAEYDGL